MELRWWEGRGLGQLRSGECTNLEEWTHGPTDGRMDGPSYRDVRTHLKMVRGGWWVI